MCLLLGPAGFLRRDQRPDIMPADHQPLDGAVFNHDFAEVNVAERRPRTWAAKRPTLKMPAYCRVKTPPGLKINLWGRRGAACYALFSIAPVLSRGATFIQE